MAVASAIPLRKDLQKEQQASNSRMRAGASPALGTKFYISILKADLATRESREVLKRKFN